MFQASIPIPTTLSAMPLFSNFGIWVDTRPAAVATRQTIGPWEGDRIHGATGTGNLVTLVERNPRFSLMVHTVSREAEAVTRAICALFKPWPAKVAPASHLRQRQGVCPARSFCAGDRPGRAFRPPRSLLGAGHERKHQRADPPAPSQAGVLGWQRPGGTPADRHLSERPSAEGSWLADAAGEAAGLP